MSEKETYCRDMSDVQTLNMVKEIIEGAYSFQAVRLLRAFLENEMTYEKICEILYSN